MSGGRFDPNVGRVRPGTYINVDGNAQNNAITYGTRGVAVVPLMAYGWGENGKFIKVEASNVNGNYAALGDYVSNIPMIREAIKNAATVLAYISNKGQKATKEITLAAASGDDPAVTLTVTAKYAGTRGNAIKIASVANTDETFDVTIYIGTEAYQTYEGVSTIEDLIEAGSDFVDFSGTGALAAFASASLAGGSTAESTNQDMTAFLDALEGVKFNTVAFPFTEEAAQASCISKIKYLRDSVGATVQGVIPDGTADYEGIINLVNAVILDTDETLSVAQCTAFVAGATAGASELESNTYLTYDGASSIVGNFTNEQAEAAIKAGKFFFSYADDGSVHCEYDINSLHVFTSTRPDYYRKNKVIRVIDSICDTIKATFPPNRFRNDTVGWDAVDGLGQTILSRYQDEGAITEVDLSSDFLVDRSKSAGDSMYINVGIKAVDMAEKLYFTVTTR